MATIKNLDRLITKLDNISTLDTEKYVKSATTFVHAQAKTLAPADTGRLRNSIHQEVKRSTSKIVGRVFTNLNYAPYVEFGTGVRGNGNYPYANELDFQLVYKEDWHGMRPQPYMYPAIKGAESYIKNLISKGVQTEINKIAKGGK